MSCPMIALHLQILLVATYVHAQLAVKPFTDAIGSVSAFAQQGPRIQFARDSQHCHNIHKCCIANRLAVRAKHHPIEMK